MIKKYIIIAIKDEYEMEMNRIRADRRRGFLDSQAAQSDRIVALDTIIRKLLKVLEDVAE